MFGNAKMVSVMNRVKIKAEVFGYFNFAASADRWLKDIIYMVSYYSRISKTVAHKDTPVKNRELNINN